MLTRRALSASQCASSPSPSEVARPMPVIQTSTGAECDGLVLAMSVSGILVSAMGHQFCWKSDAPGFRIHVHAQIRTGERDMAEGEGRVRPQLAADPDLGFSHGIARAFMENCLLYTSDAADDL